LRCHDWRMGDWFGNRRDRAMIERELRILATVRTAYREHGHVLPSMGPVDALLDELLELGPAGAFGAHRVLGGRPG
jgi:hypothetical protein